MAPAKWRPFCPGGRWIKEVDRHLIVLHVSCIKDTQAALSCPHSAYHTWLPYIKGHLLPHFTYTTYYTNLPRVDSTQWKQSHHDANFAITGGTLFSVCALARILPPSGFCYNNFWCHPVAFVMTISSATNDDKVGIMMMLISVYTVTRILKSNIHTYRHFQEWKTTGRFNK